MPALSVEVEIVAKRLVVAVAGPPAVVLETHSFAMIVQTVMV